MKVLVPGGTGLLGRAVVAGLVGAGHEVRVLSRDPSRVVTSPHVDVRRGDLRDPDSLAAAVTGVDVVVNCATDPRSASDVDVAGTANLTGAMQAAAVGHLVQVSIVGVDRIPIRFYRTKRQAELVVEQQSVPWTIQRATQFHQFIDRMIRTTARLPVLPAPRGLRFQPIAVEDVAAVLVQHVANGPAGMAPPVGGPEILTHRQLATTWLRAHGRRRVLVPVPLPGKVGRAFRDGANLSPDHRSRGVRWQSYLDAAAAADAGTELAGRDG